MPNRLSRGVLCRSDPGRSEDRLGECIARPRSRSGCSVRESTIQCNRGTASDRPKKRVQKKGARFVNTFSKQTPSDDRSALLAPLPTE